VGGGRRTIVPLAASEIARLSKSMAAAKLKIRISHKVVGAPWLDAGLVNNAAGIDASIDDVES